jgi:hypothetical protein
MPDPCQMYHFLEVLVTSMSRMTEDRQNCHLAIHCIEVFALSRDLNSLLVGRQEQGH